MTQIEKMPHQHAGRTDHRQHQPGMRMTIGHGVVIADHDQYHRQGEIVVVHRTALAVEVRRRIEARAGPAAGAGARLPAPVEVAPIARGEHTHVQNLKTKRW